MTNVLEADGIQLSFGTRQILQDIYLRCETGKITGLLGSNGAGKSCLMQVICGTQNAYAQSVRINGKMLLPNKRCLPQLAYLPQFHFVPKRTLLRRIFSDYGVDFSEFILSFPEVRNKEKQQFGKLSGGEQRLIEIYLVASGSAKFILLDEPFTHLMPLHIERVISWLQIIKQHKGILISDHLYQHILPIADTLYLLRNGKTHLIMEEDDLSRLGYIRWS